ncbi:DUF6302 family protein [Streptomyces sp. JUS-F4]|uniref:DUF6302 family protein n=1 Tax=Streptomyces sp. JUS-F4 TaxID=2951988 RepID=UPI00349E6E79
MLREADLRQLAPGEEHRHAHHAHAVPRSPRRGTRRGEDNPASCLCFGFKVCDLLLGRPGFPDLRVQWSSHLDTCFVVE